MQKILITGASGILGRELCGLLSEKNIPFCTAGRTNPALSPNHRKLDLLSEEGLENVLDDIDTVFHLASATRNYDPRVDIDGTRKLLAKAKEKRVHHFIFISIVGTDQVPLKYYRIKWQTEKVIQENFQNFSILRATQFHELIDNFFHKLDKFPFIFLPRKWKVQPIEPGIVAKRLVEIAQKLPTHSVENIGGEEILTSEEMIRDWLNVRGSKKKIIFMPLPGKGSSAIAAGKLTCPEASNESITWKEWLNRKYSRIT